MRSGAVRQLVGFMALRSLVQIQPPLPFYNGGRLSKQEDKDDVVTITRKEYEFLLGREEWLSWLEAAGVDNWQGFDYAREMQDEQHQD